VSLQALENQPALQAGWQERGRMAGGCPGGGWNEDDSHGPGPRRQHRVRQVARGHAQAHGSTPAGAATI